MPLYEISSDGLIPFRQLKGGAKLYESEIEDLLWVNLDELTGEVLFSLRRQALIVGGGRPDILALDSTGSVVVIEVKRDVDRSQIAQCLEYAGWARTTSLDELAGLYHRGVEQFWSDWQSFTETEEPRRITKSPRLILVARDFDGRTDSALSFLQENGLPITIIRLALYEDIEGRRFLDLEGVEEPEFSRDAGFSAPAAKRTRVTHRASIADLVGAGLLASGEQLVWDRPLAGQELRCTVTDDGRLRLLNGEVHASASGAAGAAAGGGSFDGWEAWRAPQRGNVLLAELRRRYLAADAAESMPANRTTGAGASIATEHEERPHQYGASSATGSS
jgi:hypothetical protein